MSPTTGFSWASATRSTVTMARLIVGHHRRLCISPTFTVTVMEFTQIRYEIDGPAAVITLDRPEQLNAFTVTMVKELVAAFDAADADDDVRAVIVTGAGRVFCAGADLSSGGDTFDAGAQGMSAAAGRVERRATAEGSCPCASSRAASR